LGFFDLFRKSANILIEPFRRGQTVWSIQNDKAYIKEAYNNVVWVYACVSKIASCVSLPGWTVYRRSKKGKEEINEASLFRIFNTRVNDFYTSADFFEMWATYLALNGKFFCMYDNPVRPTRLTVLKPYEMEITSGSKLEMMIEKYRYQNELDIKPEMVLWDKFFDPLDFYDGLSPIRAAARTIDTENSAITWNKDSFDNMGIPPGAIYVMNASKSLIENIKERWKSTIAGSKNARTPFVVDAEKMNYVNFGLNQIDMDFLNQRKVTRTEICAAFGVPSQCVGDPEGQTYANYEQAVVSLWSETIVPKYLNHIRRSLNMNIVQKYDENYFVDYNLDEIQVLQENEEAKISRIRGLWIDNLITQAEARAELGREGGEDIYYSDFMMGGGGEDGDDGLG
jgi:HK97 family phage portal protein